MITEEKIIRLFIEEKEPKTIREISKKIKADYKIIYTAAKRLLEKKILLGREVGKSILCELNPSYYGIEIYSAEHRRKEELLKNKNISLMYREVIKNAGAFFVFIIFGSYAKGKETANSDIDIIIISNEKEIEKKVNEMLSLMPLKTHALFFTEEEFIRMKDSKKSNVVKEAVENNIILYGIENYYLIKNA
ncbi:hypothetical protein A3K73_03645 [Candidatus Pacearchaeota archaeon RBG_13_36_9]|nr:MAG: hypothetical protein A3K73_03645 [Candidatus Pacearchaeota archaeon RBG_13_36_9]